MDKLAILIPAHNELKNLKKILDNKLRFFIVDDCSTDGTEEFLIDNKYQYIKNDTQIGYESAVLKGFNYLLNNFNDIETICTFDGDNEHPKEDIEKIYNYFEKYKIDLLICNREKKNRFSERLISLLFKLRYGIKDPLTGMKLYKINKLKEVLNRADSNHFLVDLTYYFLKENLNVKNFTIETNRNLTNSKIGFNLGVEIKILKLIKFLI